MTALRTDLRLALRTLRKSPQVTAAAILSLALAIGATTAVFSLVKAILLAPLPVPDPDRLVAVYTLDESRGESAAGPRLPISFPNFEDLRDRSDAFAPLVATVTVPVALIAGGAPEEIPGQLVSAGYFSALGVEPAVGRLFLPEEEATLGGHPVTVLSHRLWQRRFGGDPGVVGRTLTLNDSPFTVVGVASEGFAGTGLLAPDLWLPMAMRGQVVTGFFRDLFAVRRALMLDVFGRLRPGLDLAAAQTALGAVAAGLAEDYPDVNRGRGFDLVPLAQATIPPDQRGLFVRAGGMLMAVVALVLLIACVNVANLLLARAVARRREVAIRLSLGASRGRLIRQLLTDGLVLAAAGGLFGLLLARWGRDLLWALRPPMLELAAPDLRFDATVVAFTLGVSLGTGVLFALAPALVAARANPLVALTGRSEPPPSDRIWNARNALVMAQVALSLVALVGAGLFVASLQQLRRTDPGFAADRLAAFTFNLGSRGYQPGQIREFTRRAAEAAAGVPGVAAVTLATNLPLGPFPGMLRTVVPEGNDAGDPAAGVFATVDAVGEGYFDTLGVPIESGRAFTADDREDGRPVAVVNEQLARRLWPGQDAVGKRFGFTGDDRAFEVVGVSADRKLNSLGESPQPCVDLPLAQNPAEFLNLILRSDGDPAAALAAAEREVQALDPALALTNVATLAERVRRSVWAPRLGAMLMALFGVVALILAAVGIYGTLSYSVRRRDRELGIRMAVGAQRRDIVLLVVRRAMTLVGVGGAVGLAAAALGARALGGLLHGVGPFDPAAFAAAAAVLAGVALAASLVPAGRAAGGDPTAALRSE